MQLQAAADKQRSKRTPVIEAHDQSALKKAKAITNATLNKNLRPLKFTQNAAHTANNASQYALANMQMTEFNKQARVEQETINQISNFVHSSFM